MPECDMNVAAKECAVSIGDSVCESVWEYGCFPVVETSAPCAPTSRKVKISPLWFADVVSGKAVKASKDSEAQIPLSVRICRRKFPPIPWEGLIDGVVGLALVPLTNVDIQLAAEPGKVNFCATELPVVYGIVVMSDK